MKIDTPASIALARRVHCTFGSWEEVREAAVRGDDGVYRIPHERLHGASRSTTDRAEVPRLDRLVARLEVSRLATVPLGLSILSVWPLFLLVCGLQTLTGVRAAVPVLIAAAGWCVLAGCEVTRRIWTTRHPYASPRWLRGVRAAVGDDLAVRALAYLIQQHDHDPDYVVKRSDIMTAVQVELADRREAQRRAEGFRLVEPTPIVVPSEQELEALRTAVMRNLTDDDEAGSRT